MTICGSRRPITELHVRNAIRCILGRALWHCLPNSRFVELVGSVEFRSVVRYVLCVLQRFLFHDLNIGYHVNKFSLDPHYPSTTPIYITECKLSAQVGW